MISEKEFIKEGKEIFTHLENDEIWNNKLLRWEVNLTSLMVQPINQTPLGKVFIVSLPKCDYELVTSTLKRFDKDTNKALMKLVCVGAFRSSSGCSTFEDKVKAIKYSIDNFGDKETRRITDAPKYQIDELLMHVKDLEK